MKYEIEFSKDVEQDLKSIPAYYRGEIMDAIMEQLTHQPTSASKNKKILFSLVPPWDHEPPVRELRIGNYWAFYDVTKAGIKVYVRAIRLKKKGEHTEDIL